MYTMSLLCTFAGGAANVAATTASVPSLSSWTCTDCFIRNSAKDNSCIACQASRPGAAVTTAASNGGVLFGSSTVLGTGHVVDTHDIERKRRVFRCGTSFCDAKRRCCSAIVVLAFHFWRRRRYIESYSDGTTYVFDILHVDAGVSGGCCFAIVVLAFHLWRRRRYIES